MVETPRNSYETKITDLNNDCLIEIGKNLDKRDLYNLKQTNKIFGEAIDYAVAKIEFEFVIKINEEGRLTEDANIIGGFLYFFGNKIKCLNILFESCLKEYNKDKVFKHIQNSIEKYCTDGNIKQCHLNKFKICRTFFKRSISLFNALESLKLIDTVDDAIKNINWLSDFIAASVNLKEFQFAHTSYESNLQFFDIFGAIAPSKLERVEINLFCHDMDMVCIDKLPINLTLKELEIKWNRFNPLVLTYFPNIERVTCFRCLGDFSLDPILKLSSLKTLYCDPTWLDNNPTMLSFVEKLANKNQLEAFAITIGYFNEKDIPSEEIQDQYVEHLCKMTDLKLLHLKNGFYLCEHLPLIGQCLKKLEEFTFGSYLQLFEEFKPEYLNNILEFVKVAQNLKVLHCSDFNQFDAHEICEKLMEIRKKQQNTEILCIRNSWNLDNWTLTVEQRKYIELIENEAWYDDEDEDSEEEMDTEE